MNSREKVEKAYGDSLLLRYEEKINMFTELLDSHAEEVMQEQREACSKAVFNYLEYTECSGCADNASDACLAARPEKK